MAALWRKCLDLPTGERLELELERRCGETRIKSCTAYAVLVGEGEGIDVTVPLHLSRNGFDFLVLIEAKA